MFNNKRNHFIAYVRWDIVLEWKKEEIKAGRLSKKNQVKPYAYGTDAEEISDKIEKGDILWILTIPKYGEFSSYPSLNAMIVVKEIIDQKNEKEENKIKKIPEYIRKKWNPIKEKKWRFVIIGDMDDSKYFPINDSYEEIVKPILQEKIMKLEGRMKGKSFGYIAQHFQKIRALDRNLGKEIYDYHKEIKKKKPLFISYRHGRGNKVVKEIVERLLKEKINCWLDIGRIPQGLTEKECKKIKKYFVNEFENAIEESSGFLAIKRRDYFESEWTLLEYNTALKKKGKNFCFWEEELNKASEQEGRRMLLERIIKVFSTEHPTEEKDVGVRAKITRL